MLTHSFIVCTFCVIILTVLVHVQYIYSLIHYCVYFLCYTGAEDSDLDDILADLCKLEEDTKALQLAAADVSSNSRYILCRY